MASDTAFHSPKHAGAEVVRQAFGSHLTQQGRGFYVTLELLAILWGTTNGKIAHPLPALESGERLTYSRRGHDFARRWMAEEDLTSQDRENVAGGADETLRALLISLRVPIPFRRSVPKWGSQHLYPYIGELIHYDAVPRRGKPSVERFTYRGGGALAHKILRSDPDAGRLNGNREGLGDLVAEDSSSLGRLALALASHDVARPDHEFNDDEENSAIVHQTPWVELLRTGVQNITSRREVPRAKQVELLMHWVPYCIARHQLSRACEITGRSDPPIPVGIDPQGAKIRQQGRRVLDQAGASVIGALMTIASQLEEEHDGRQAESLRALQDGSRKWAEGARAFFTGTLATVGALNAHTGKRHFTLSLSLLEALVHATLQADEQLAFEDFCTDRLYRRLNLVTDDRSGALAGLTAQIDVGDLRSNGAFLAGELSALGLLHEYSDATRLVHAEASR